MAKLKHNFKAGITLMEVIVSVTLFVVLMLTVTQIFQMVLISQRRSIATQNTQESLKYFFEVVSKEIRMAYRNDTDENQCPIILAGEMFAQESGVLYLRNYHNECVEYYLDVDGRFMIKRGDKEAQPITPNVIEVEDLQFIITEEAGKQPYITINILAKARDRELAEAEIRMQTTVASRYYRPPIE